MGIFQQQFNSLLGSALRADIGKKVVNSLPSQEKLGEDQTLQQDMTNEYTEALGEKKYAQHFSKMTTTALDKDPMSMDSETLVAVGERLNAQQRKIAEQQRGIDAQKATTIGMINKLMSQGHAKRSKTLAKWQKDLTGGNE